MVDDDRGMQWWQTVGVHEATRPSWISLYEPAKDTNMGMTLDDLLPSKYLKKSDIGDEEHIVTIRKLTKTNVAREDAAPEYKAVIQFEEFPKPMVANKTNLKRIAAALGDDIELWTGKQIVLYYDPDVEFGGETVGGIRVRGIKRKAAPKRASDDDVNAKFRDAEEDREIPF